MVSCSDDARNMTEESSARVHRGRRAVIRGLVRTNLQSQLQGNPPTSSGETNLKISSTRLFNEIKERLSSM
ncbi:unnamed protein product, partial [Protopolystoma xenopodis]